MSAAEWSQALPYGWVTTTSPYTKGSDGGPPKRQSSRACSTSTSPRALVPARVHAGSYTSVETTYPATRPIQAKTSRMVLWRRMTSPPARHVSAWKPSASSGFEHSPPGAAVSMFCPNRALCGQSSICVPAHGWWLAHVPTVVVLAEEVQPMLVLQGHDALDSAHALGGPASRQPWAQHRGATTSTHKVNAVTAGGAVDGIVPVGLTEDGIDAEAVRLNLLAEVDPRSGLVHCETRRPRPN